MDKKGFVTLISLIVTVAVIAVLAAAIFVWIDPVERIGVASDKKRAQDIAVLKNTLSEYVSDHKGVMPVLGAITSNKKVLCSVQSAGNLSCDGQSQRCLTIDDSDFLGKYIGDLPVDPDKTSAADSGYFLKKDSDNKLVIGACSQYGLSPVVATTTIKISCSVYGGGYCWNISGENQTCDTYCSSIGRECVDFVSYGPSGGDSYCILNLAFGDCDLGNSCEAQNNNTPPRLIDDYSSCYYQANPVDCSVSGGASHYSVCPCQ